MTTAADMKKREAMRKKISDEEDVTSKALLSEEEQNTLDEQADSSISKLANNDVFHDTTLTPAVKQIAKMRMLDLFDKKGQPLDAQDLRDKQQYNKGFIDGISFVIDKYLEQQID